MNTPWYFTISIFNFFDAIHVPVIELGIIFCSQDKLHSYFRPVTKTFVLLNPNFTKNAKPLYYPPGFAVDCILVFFSPVFEVYSDGFSKELALKILINTLLKYIGNNLAIILVTYDNF